MLVGQQLKLDLPSIAWFKKRAVAEAVAIGLKGVSGDCQPAPLSRSHMTDCWFDSG